MKKIWTRLKSRYPVLIIWERKARKVTLPGLEGIPVFDVYHFFAAEIRANSLPTRSKSIAFSFFLALFPALTFVFTLIPFLPYFRDLDTHIFEFLKQVLPNEQTYTFIRSFLEPLLRDLAKHKRGGLLTGSFFLVLFLTSNGVMAMMSSFDKSHESYKKRNAFQKRYVALKITFLLILVFILSIVLVILGKEFISIVAHLLNIQNKFTHLLLDTLRYILIVLVFFFSISLTYYYAPAVKKKYKFVSTGSTVATILSVLISVGYSYYVSNFGKLNLIFGSIGSIMFLMIWLNINAFVLLIGYEINASIYFNKVHRSKELERKAPGKPVDE